jgi:GTPase SAR1 family protein
MQERYSSVQNLGADAVVAPMAPSQSAADPSTGSTSAQLTDCLNQVAALPGADLGTCKWLRDKLAGATFNLVVAGQFKRGKSTLINALLGEPVLPVGVVPLTSVVTAIQYGASPLATVELGQGEVRELPISALEHYVTERGNPRNIKQVGRVQVRYPCAWLSNGVQLIDTPGIDSVYEHNTDVTHDFIPQADAVIFVASVEQPLSRAELDFLQGIRRYAGKIFCVLNKIDQLSAAELRESVAFCTRSVQQALEADIRIFPVSARAALQPDVSAAATADAGVHELKQALLSLMQTDRNAIWRRSAAATLLRMLAQIRFTLELERSALDKPLDALQEALTALRQQKEQSRLAQVEHSVLLQAHVGTLLRERIEPGLQQFKEQQKQQLLELLQQWSRQLPHASSRQLQAGLEQRLVAQVRTAYDGWVAREEPALARAFDELCERFWTQLRRELDALLARCGELFGLAFEPVATASVWRNDSRFDYKFWTEPTSLAALSSSVTLLLPRLLGGPLVLRRARRRALELVETHAGRLRSDLEQRLHHSVMDFRNRLVLHMQDTISHIENAIGRGIERYAAGEADMSTRRAALADLLERAARVETQVRSMAR